VADQWQSTADHAAPAAAAPGDVWQSTADHAADLNNPANKYLYTTPEGTKVYAAAGDDMKQPEGSAIGRFAGALGQGLLGVAQGASPLPDPQVVAQSFAKLLRGEQLGANDVPAIHTMLDMLKGHVNEAQEAAGAVKRNSYIEAFGHGLAAATPLVGPAAAQAGERIGGTPPTYDKYGNLVQPGMAPDVAGGTGAGISVLAPMFAGPAAELAGKIPLPNVPKIPSTLNPVQQGAVDFLRQNDVPLNVGTITGNKFVKAAQALVQNQPLGATTAMRAGQATEQGLTRVAGNLADQAHPYPVTPESAGAAAPRALGKKIEQLSAVEDAAYGKAFAGRNDPAHSYELPLRLDKDGGQITGTVNMPVDVRDIKYLAQPIFDEMQWMPASDRASSAGYTALKNILEGDDFIPAWQAERGLSGLKTMARVDNKSGVRNASQGIGASLIPDLQANINASVASTGEAAIRGLQEGRATHASKMEIAGLAEELRSEPVQAFQQMTWKNDTGIDFLRRIHDQAPEVTPQIGRALIEKLFSQATAEGGFGKARTLLNKWQDLGPETKKLLYPNPQLRANLDKFFNGAALVAENPNPSGTAVVGSLIPGGLLLVHNPITGGAWLLGGLGASKLLFSPAGVRMLTEGLNSSNPGAAALQASQILRAAGPANATAVPPCAAGTSLMDRLKTFLGDERGSIPMRGRAWKPGMKLDDIQPLQSPSGGRLTNEDVMRHLESQTVKYHGAVSPDAPAAVKLKRMLTSARKELADQMAQKDPKLDFYTVDTGVADADMARAFPELGTDSVKRTIQKMFSAALSPSQYPREEAYFGGRLYEIYRNTGRIPLKQPSGKAWPSQGATPAMVKMQGFLDKFGEKGLVDLLTSQQTGRFLKGINKSVELKMDAIGPGSLILGPKVGRYFNDIMGIKQEGSTVDLWACRGAYRRLGYMFDAQGKPIESPQKIGDREAIMAADEKLAREQGLVRNQVQSGLWHYEQDLYRRLGMPVKTFARSDGTGKLLDDLGIPRSPR
jgi:hypothetical protein